MRIEKTQNSHCAVVCFIFWILIPKKNTMPSGASMTTKPRPEP